MRDHWRGRNDANGSHQGTPEPLWRVEYDGGPQGGYRLVFTLDPSHPPKRAGNCWRATYAGARRRAEELNAMDWPGQQALPLVEQTPKRGARGRRAR